MKMKNIFFTVFIFLLGNLFSIAYSEETQSSTPVLEKSFPIVNWISQNSSDDVIIQNGSGASLIIEINVAKNTALENTPGINVKNCGTITHIKAGGSGICRSNDANHPISFSSDNSTDSTGGTYQIKFN